MDLNRLIMETKVYTSPEIIYIETLFEGVLCSSNEPLGENQGQW